MTILANIRSRMTKATKFSRQNDACSRVRTTWENLVLVVALVLEYIKRSLLSSAFLTKRNVLKNQSLEILWWILDCFSWT